MCGEGGSLAAERADLNSAICGLTWSSVGIGTSSQPSPVVAARLMAASTWAPMMMGGRGCCIGRGRMVALVNCQCRPWWVTLSPLQSLAMISTPSLKRLTRSDMGTRYISYSSGR